MDDTMEEIKEDEVIEDIPEVTIDDVSKAIAALADAVSDIAASIVDINTRLDSIIAARIEDGAEFTEPDEIEEAVDDAVEQIMTVDDIDKIDLDM